MLFFPDNAAPQRKHFEAVIHLARDPAVVRRAISKLASTTASGAARAIDGPHRQMLEQKLLEIAQASQRLPSSTIMASPAWIKAHAPNPLEFVASEVCLLRTILSAA